MAKATDLNLRIEGMHCASCVNSIEHGVKSLEGVSACRVNLATNSAVVSFDQSRVDEKSVLEKISQLGFSPTVGRPDILTANEQQTAEARRRFILSLVATVPLMIIAMLPMVTGQPIVSAPVDALLQGLIAAFVLFYCGWSIVEDAAIQARYVRANMNSLIALGTFTAFGWSIYATVRIFQGHSEWLYFESVGMIITLILLGRFLEARAKGRAGQAIRALWNLRPAQTTALINNVEVDIEADAVREGMLIRVKPGERLPADGVIEDGRPVIDESMVTGESTPVEHTPGDKVIGGSLNGNVPFLFKVTAAGEQSYLATVIRMGADAQAAKAPIQRLADRVAAVFVPIVLGLALITLAAWFLMAPDSPLLIRSTIA
ncbi:HAD-IC family P-type ATPase, partial [candidate division GN15 bacterium]|nr:HAD-IC family P-type ATPase [candidate division GN15 bacterium]